MVRGVNFKIRSIFIEFTFELRGFFISEQR